MTTFDLVETRSFFADLESRMDRCDNGEGMECANLDESLTHYAEICCEFYTRMREWGHAVFIGKVAYDPAVEKTWIDEGRKLYLRARNMAMDGKKAETPCYILYGQPSLEASLWHFEQMLTHWVSPRLAISPGARQSDALRDGALEAKKSIEALPSLPADWKPADAGQQMRFKKMGRQAGS